MFHKPSAAAYKTLARFRPRDPRSAGLTGESEHEVLYSAQRGTMDVKTDDRNLPPFGTGLTYRRLAAICGWIVAVAWSLAVVYRYQTGAYYVWFLWSR